MKTLNLALTLLMAIVSLNASAATYKIDIQNKTSDKLIDVKIYSVDKVTDLHIVLGPGESYFKERVSISEPASYGMGAWSEDRHFFCHQGSGPFPDSWALYDRKCSKNVPSKQGEYESFQNVRSDFEISNGKFALTLRSVK